jgi:tetratricopeptide (TPR) repeat protein
LRRFSEGDAAKLVEALISNVPNPALKKLTTTERLSKFLNSRRQLLIAMKEAVGGGEFDGIIENEFASLKEQERRIFFLIVAVSTLARVGIQKGQMQQIWIKGGYTKNLEICLSELLGIVEPGANGRLLARHELYVRHIIDNQADLNELRDAFVRILDFFGGYKIPVIRSIDKLDGQLFKFLFHHATLYKLFAKRGSPELAIDIYNRFDLLFQQDGHYWLQYGLFNRQMRNHREALRMLKLSIEAHEENPFAEHAYAQELFVHAIDYVKDKQSAAKMAKEAEERLLRLHASKMGADYYPLLTLFTLDSKFMLRNGMQNVARQKAMEYFEKILLLEKLYPNNKDILSAKTAALKLATTGIWRPPVFSNQQLDDGDFVQRS